MSGQSCGAHFCEQFSNSKEAIIYTGWFQGGTHYLGIMASCMSNVSLMVKGEVHQKSALAIPLLSISPIAVVVGVDNDEQEIYQEYSDSTAESDVFNFEDVFNLLNINIHQWYTAQLADNSSLNKRIAELMEISHVQVLAIKRILMYRT